MRQKCRVTAEREEYKKVSEVVRANGANSMLLIEALMSGREIKSFRETKSCRGQGISMTEAVTTPGIAFLQCVVRNAKRNAERLARPASMSPSGRNWFRTSHL